MTRQHRHRRHTGTVCDQQTGVAVAERMHVQPFRGAVLLQNQLEPPGEGAERHGVLAVMLAECGIIHGQLSILISIRLSDAFTVILFEEPFHFRREVHVAAPCRSLGVLDDDILPCNFYDVSLDADALSCAVDIGPLQATALSPPYSSRNDEFKIRLVFEALIFRSRDDLLHRFLIRNELLFFLAGIFIGPPCRIVFEKTVNANLKL